MSEESTPRLTRLEKMVAEFLQALVSDPARGELYNSLMRRAYAMIKAHRQVIAESVFDQAFKSTACGFSGSGAVWCAMFLAADFSLSRRLGLMCDDERFDTDEERATTERQIALLMRLMASCDINYRKQLTFSPNWRDIPEPRHRLTQFVSSIEVPDQTFSWPADMHHLDAWVGLDAALDQLRPTVPEIWFSKKRCQNRSSHETIFALDSLRTDYVRGVLCTEPEPSPLETDDLTRHLPGGDDDDSSQASDDDNSAKKRPILHTRPDCHK